MPPQHVAVLGAGISGLTSAFHLARRFPNTKISLIEKSPRVGGWIKSDRLDLRGGQSILLEAGPRTLRPQSKALLELLEGSVLRTYTTSPAARNRFLHIPGTRGLTLLPSSLLSLLTSRLTPTIVSAAMRDLCFPSNISSGVSDEVLGSALVHGIYAADSRELSVRAAFPSLWDTHIRGGGSVTRSMFMRRLRTPPDPENYSLGGIPKFMDNVSVFSFRRGVGQLTSALRERLVAMENVELIHSGASRLSRKGDSFQILTETREISSTHVVSALPLPQLSAILNEEESLPHLTANAFSSVTVVNLVFDKPQAMIHPAGFGYLVPRATAPSNDSSLESAILGTVFDSAALSGQDNSDSVTKVTVMLRGPRIPDLDVPKLVTALEVHLGHELPAPVGSQVHWNADCIPVPSVGHSTRMAELLERLKAAPWNGRLAVIGASVDGVSVSDCVESGATRSPNLGVKKDIIRGLMGGW